MTEIKADDVIKSFVERWGESALNPDSNCGIEFTVEFSNKQHEPDKVIDGIKYCGRCLVGITSHPPSDELVEKIITEVGLIVSLVRDDEEDIRGKIRTLLQSRQPDKDTAKWMDRVHELEVELAKVRENVGTEDELKWLNDEIGNCDDWLTSGDVDDEDEEGSDWKKRKKMYLSFRKKLSPESEGGEEKP